LCAEEALSETIPTDAGEIWARTFSIVRRDVDVPTVWLAMQAVKPLVLEGNRFVAALPSDQQYLAMNLESHEYAMAIEDALRQVTGHPIAFHLIEGSSLSDWESLKALSQEGNRVAAAAHSAAPPPERFRPDPGPGPGPSPASRPSAFVGDILSWEKLNERIAVEARTFPNMKFPHGQALFLLHAVQLISAAMDQFMPAGHSDIIADRQLNKAIERLGLIVGNLDPLFVSLELMRYRQTQNKL
jgi:hypothetical protein